MMQESQVGSKGELFPPKEMREKLGLKPCTKVVFTVEAGRLVVEAIPTVDEMMQRETPVEITLEEFHRERRALSKLAET
jgi:AbrB family looped-hinge helix DNA binding protein